MKPGYCYTDPLDQQIQSITDMVGRGMISRSKAVELFSHLTQIGDEYQQQQWEEDSFLMEAAEDDVHKKQLYKAIADDDPKAFRRSASNIMRPPTPSLAWTRIRRHGALKVVKVAFGLYLPNEKDLLWLMKEHPEVLRACVRPYPPVLEDLLVRRLTAGKLKEVKAIVDLADPPLAVLDKALEAAVNARSTKGLEYLLGLRKTIRPLYTAKAMAVAASKKKKKAATLLIAKGAVPTRESVEASMSEGDHYLLKAYLKYNKEDVRRFVEPALRKGATVSFFRALVKYGAVLSEADVHEAVLQDRGDVLKYIHSCAVLNGENVDLEAGLTIAFCSGHTIRETTIKPLTELGASLGEGLGLAVLKDNEKWAKYFLKKGAHVWGHHLDKISPKLEPLLRERLPTVWDVLMLDDDEEDD